MISRKKRDKHLQGALHAICMLMRSYGETRQSAEKRFLSAIESGFSRGSSTEAAGKVSRLADICTRWHLEKEFVDENGKARPLKYNGRSGSLMRLASKVVGRKAAQEVVKELIARRLVKRNSKGEWSPKSRVVAPVALNDAQIIRSSSMIERLLRTVTYNSDKQYRGDVLLEVLAQVPRLPKEEIRDFKKFAKAQGLIFAKAVDDWLESRNLSRGRARTRNTSEAGVVAFAFVQ